MSFWEKNFGSPQSKVVLGVLLLGVWWLYKTTKWWWAIVIGVALAWNKWGWTHD